MFISFDMIIQIIKKDIIDNWNEMNPFVQLFEGIHYMKPLPKG